MNVLMGPTIIIGLFLGASLQVSAITDPIAGSAAPPVTGSTLPSGDATFNQTLSLQSISFHITCANAGSQNRLTIAPKGLQQDNTVIKREIDGTVTGAEVADLNVDGSPEIYVFVSSAGSDSYGSLVGYSANNKKSLSEIYLPPLQDHPKAAKGHLEKPPYLGPLR
ncbi:MAG: PliI family lysozyme inhibitor of I-type lysozyme [Methylococcaceae bacterium]